MLHLGAMLLALSGCASQGTATSRPEAPPQAAIAPKTGQAMPPGGLTPPPALDTAPIQAGHSEPEAGEFTLSDGRLRPDIQAYAEEVSRTRNIPQAQIVRLLGAARYDAEVARLMAPSATRIKRSWVTYRKRFVEPVRIAAGTRFWEDNAATLARVQADSGVPAAIIVAIIGVETIYGRYTGSFRVLDALATLGFRHPDAARAQRSQLFRDQLADLALLHHLGWLDATTVTGSFAGAMGLPQFMPGSLLRYAADGDGDGRIALDTSTADAIASVARFLRLHGWVPGLPVFAPTSLPHNPAAHVDGGLAPTLDWATLAREGSAAQTLDTAWQNHPLGMVDLVDEPRNTVEYRLATPNFFAITHYNRSYFYATAVAELARELQQARAQAMPAS